MRDVSKPKFEVGTMNYKMLLGLVAATSVSGCYVTDRDYGHGGDVTFTWTFAGQQCAAVPQISSVRISIPGEVIQNDGVFPCLVSNYPGIILQNFAPGSYTYTIQGLNYSSDVLYQATGTFIVDGNVSVQVDLAPLSANSFAYLMWTFPPNSVSQTPNCDQAGVAFVDVVIDGGTPQRASCSAGFSQPGFRTADLPAGRHQIELRGVDSTNFPVYRFVGTLQTYAGSPISASYGLLWNIGGASISWQLVNGGVIQSCDLAGVDTVNVNFRDSSGAFVYGSGDPQPCSGAPILYNGLLPDRYQVILSATSHSGVQYSSSGTNPPTVSVTAGVFVDPNSTPLTVAITAQ